MLMTCRTLSLGALLFLTCVHLNHAQFEMESALEDLMTQGMSGMGRMGRMMGGPRGGVRGGALRGGTVGGGAMGGALGGMGTTRDVDWLLDDPFNASRMGSWNRILGNGGVFAGATATSSTSTRPKSTSIQATIGDQIVAKTLSKQNVKLPTGMQGRPDAESIQMVQRALAAKIGQHQRQSHAQKQAHAKHQPRTQQQTHTKQQAQTHGQGQFTNLQLQFALAVRNMQIQRLLANQRMLQRQQQQQQMGMNTMGRGFGQNHLIMEMLFE